MKPINSKEKNKQFWQFVFIFFGLAVIPVALIFFYYKVKKEISESEERKLVNYSNFEHTQKLILKKMIEVDSNINKYAEANTENPKLLDKKIVDGLTDLAKMDTSIKMVQLVSDGYAKHYTHVTKLVEAEEKVKDATTKLQEAEAKLKAIQSNQMSMGAPMQMPPPAP